MTIRNSERLTSEQIALTDNYLLSLAENYPHLLAVQLLFGRCCLASLPSSMLDWDELAGAVSQLAGAILRHADSATLNLDPLPIIEIDFMMRAQGREQPELRQLLNKISQELEAQSPEVQSTGRVRLIASSLAKLGLPNRVASPSKVPSRLLKSQELWFTATTTELLDLADHLAASEVALDETGSKVLSLVALGELRNYRLDVGCKLLRTVLQLGIPDDEAVDGIDFISLQRRRDGSYGFLDRLAEKPEQSADPELALFLPLTLNAVWLFRAEALIAHGVQALAARETLV